MADEKELKVSFSNGKFVVSGEFDLGYMGVYKDSQIKILSEIDDVRDWDCVKKSFGEKEPTDEELCAFLTDCLKQYQKKISENKKMVNDNFLVNVFYDMSQCGYPFWENEKLVTSTDFDEDELWESGYDDLNEVIDDLMEEYSGTANDGSVKKRDVEAAVRKALPLFNLDAVLKSVKSECLCLRNGYLAFQCSDTLGAEILCGAYDELSENLEFTEWHNH